MDLAKGRSGGATWAIYCHGLSKGGVGAGQLGQFIAMDFGLWRGQLGQFIAMDLAKGGRLECAV